MVHRLLAANADVDAKNNDGASALMLATYAQKEAVVRSLIGSGATHGLSAALAFAEQAEANELATALREALPAASGSLGWMGWLGASAVGDGGPAAFDLGFLPLGAIRLGLLRRPLSLRYLPLPLPAAPLSPSSRSPHPSLPPSRPSPHLPLTLRPSPSLLVAAPPPL